MAGIEIPQELLPIDGRFGSGPSRVSPAQLQHVLSHAEILGTSHRQAPVKDMVARVQGMLAEFFPFPKAMKLFWETVGQRLSGTSAPPALLAPDPRTSVLVNLAASVSALTPHRGLTSPTWSPASQAPEAN